MKHVKEFFSFDIKEVNELLQKRAKEQQIRKPKSVLSSEDKTKEIKPIHTRKTLAKDWHVSEETLHTSKKVKELNDPKINKKWKQAKQGKTTIKAVKMAIDKKTYTYERVGE